MRTRILLSGTLAIAVALFSGRAAAQEQGNSPSAQTASPQQGTQSGATDVASPDDQPAAQSQDAQDQSEADKKSRAQRAKEHLKKQMSSWCVNSPVQRCWEKKSTEDSGSDEQQTKQAQSKLPPPPRSDDVPTPPPPAPGESSSKDTKVDLSPPPGDVNEHPESSPEPDATGEFHAWDPHRAMKNVEVGDYYYKRGNYRAAVSRYQEALQWKPRDAEATFKLADALDHMGKKEEARKNYQAYLKILPHGPRADEAKTALAKLR